MKADKKQKLYIATIPEIFGYGISVLGHTKQECMIALKKAYNDWKEERPDETTNFKKSFDYYGGYINQIEIGKAYNEGLTE